MELFGLIWIPDFILWIVVLATLIYLYSVWPYSSLAAHGYDGPKPKPFTGSFNLSVCDGHFGAWDLKGKELYGKTFAFYEGRQPGIMSFDTNFLKQVLVKDFSKFEDRRDLYLRGKAKHSLLDLHGDEWRRIRSMTTPFFSSGKLKSNTENLQYCVQVLKTRCDKIAESGDAFDAKELFGAYSLEAICRVAFGLKVDSQTDPNHTLITTCKAMIADISPEHWAFQMAIMFPFLVVLMDRMGVEMWPKGSIDTMTNFTREAVQERVKSQQDRPDFIQALMKAHEEVNEATHSSASPAIKGRALSDDEMVAQVLIFITAGYETVSSTSSLLLYTLARHQEWQDRVLDEINRVIGEGELTYEKLKEMTCLDMCFLESQRMYPTLMRTDRKCIESTTINGYYIPKDTLILIPIWGLHHDPEYWPDPEKYDPERFSADNRAQNDTYAFHGFGIGPRNCIGMRLAQIEVKMAVVKIIQHFKVTVSKRTKEPIKLTKAFIIKIDGGLWLELEKRQ